MRRTGTGELGGRACIEAAARRMSLRRGLLVVSVSFALAACDSSTDLPGALGAAGNEEEDRAVASATVPVVSAADSFAAGSDRIAIAGGEFLAGCAEKDPATCMADELPSGKRSVEPFRIDRTEVTVADYRACVEAGVCGTAADTEKGCNVGLPNRDRHPINCVDWDQAMVYCAWRGGRLPTEWEWERAARGVEGRRNPWGDEPADCRRAVIDEGEGNACGEGDTTFEVGSKPQGATPEGVVDLIGNVWEWTATEREGGFSRVVRGGAYYVEPHHARASFLLRFKPTGQAPFVGFRCAE